MTTITLGLGVAEGLRASGDFEIVEIPPNECYTWCQCDLWRRLKAIDRNDSKALHLWGVHQRWLHREFIDDEPWARWVSWCEQYDIDPLNCGRRAWVHSASTYIRDATHMLVSGGRVVEVGYVEYGVFVP